MEHVDTSSADPSRSSTPNPRFTSQNTTAEDLLKSQTVGLVHLSDFRKRRAEALEQKEREHHAASGASTPNSSESGAKPVKKKRKAVKKGGLSFGADEEDGDSLAASSIQGSSANTPDSRAAADVSTSATADEEGGGATFGKKRMGANAGVGYVPKSMTKSARMRETQMKEQLRKEFLLMQEAVRATEFLLPFVFYDGTNIPGSVLRIKKGDFIWVFLDRARKVGAELGVGGSDKARREWARVGVDDLMLVRGDLIIPHHYDFYYFLVNKTVGYNGRLLPHSAEPTSTTPLTTASSTPSTPSAGGLSVPDPLSKINNKTDKSSRGVIPVAPETELEGYNDDPTLTKVVDRRWYEKNKHIYPASTWEDFDPAKTYSKGGRKDAEGNAFFFSS